MPTKNANNNFEDMLDRLCHGVETISSLSRGRDTFVLDRDDVDERIFGELKNCKKLLKDIEKYFLGILLQDARNISQAAINNPSNLEEAVVSLERIWEVLRDFIREEADDIKKSKYLERLAFDLKDEIKRLEDSTEREVKKLGEVKASIMKELGRRAFEAH